MSGPHRKVSRSFDSSSGFITSRSHLTQPENELKQKLTAIDSSIKISNKKINNETRELRQILYDLQRDLKVSKSVSHYVPSPIEEQETKQTKRVRRVTIATAPKILQQHREEIIPKSTAEVKKTSTAEEGPGIAQGTSTKRRRKTSVPPVIKGKILVKDDDVFDKKEQELTPILPKKKELVDRESGKESLENNEQQEAVVNDKKEQTRKHEDPTDGGCGHCDDDGVQDDALIPSARDPVSGETSHDKPTLNSPMNQLESNDTDNETKNALQAHTGIQTIRAQEERSSTNENTKGNLSGNTITSNSKYLRGGRRRSLSESEAAYRETDKGGFVTSSLPSQNDHAHGILPPPDSGRRTRRITVAGPHPLGARRRLDIGDIPVTPFHSGTRRISVNSMHEDGRKKSRSLGKGPMGGQGLSLRRGSDEEEADKNLLTTPTRDTPRYRRTSKVSSLPPLKEERTMQKVGSQAIPSEWQNLENCRYLRKEDYEISIEDIFKKD